MKLSTEQFWDAMCNPAFQRVNLHQGMLRGEIVETDEPPEEVATFLTSKIELVGELLKPAKRKQTCGRFSCMLPKGHPGLCAIWEPE